MGRVCLLGALLLAMPPVQAGMTDYQRDRITQALADRRMQVDPAAFDGRAFAPGVDQAAANRIVNDYVRALNAAVSAWNGLTNAAKTSDEGRAFLEATQARQAAAERLRAAYTEVEARPAPPAGPATAAQPSLTDYQKEQARREAANQAAREAVRERIDAETAAQQARAEADRAGRAKAAVDKAAHRAQCVAFLEAAMKPLSREPMQGLIGQRREGNRLLPSVAAVERAAEVAAEVRPVCDAVDYDLLTSATCWYAISGPDNDPAEWCAAAREAPTLIPAMAMAGARQSIEAVGTSLIQTPEQFMERDGFLTFEGPVAFEERLFFQGGGLGAQQQHVVELLRAAGVEDPSLVWGEQRARMDALREAVERTAGQWKSPGSAGTDYSAELARRAVEAMHADAEVRDAYLSRASWKIHKNALGVPLRRTKPGYVLFKRPDDPYCQLRSYTLTEEYASGGRYQPAGGVAIGYVRFQACT